MTQIRSRLRRFARRMTRKAPGMGPGVERLAPGDPEYCEYARYLYSPRRMIFSNFVAGLARGIGMAVGFSLLGALFVYLLRQIAYENIPLLGDYIAQIIEAVEATKK